MTARGSILRTTPRLKQRHDVTETPQLFPMGSFITDTKHQSEIFAGVLIGDTTIAFDIEQ
jgi:hypothetical protein